MRGVDGPSTEAAVAATAMSFHRRVICLEDDRGVSPRELLRHIDRKILFLGNLHFLPQVDINLRLTEHGMFTRDQAVDKVAFPFAERGGQRSLTSAHKRRLLLLDLEFVRALAIGKSQYLTIDCYVLNGRRDILECFCFTFKKNNGNTLLWQKDDP